MRGFKNLQRGERRIFDYPEEFVTLPEYSAHRGHVVEVIRPLGEHEYDREPFGERMYEVAAPDGWIGHAWESELRREPERGQQ